ncbi:MAG: coenzyme F420-0:L-glutamate ligase [Candidatus Dormibacteraeota bacterium]|uniref:Coenzyme F420-0:L-glutamate ligase n=1 Tax=Candidatus Dormiibacter inghamiae TaxID=3127013 RepID=A0A934KH81_9BACT|nr:coenzyme F420-0:L-glutamate ligase [Candidatus Dormibacteraeota bacterium]MBJ7606716.1 coenzyme F420-0:L-glutamate ligase [Candidatus Dormibacteraeota bacterium]
MEVLGVEGLPEVLRGDDLAGLILARCSLQERDVVVVAQKVISKAEGRLRHLPEVRPGAEALDYARQIAGDPRLLQVILDESVRVVRAERVLIVETKHGFVCANAGVDHSNVPGEETVVLLPEDSDRSAAELRLRLCQASGVRVGVIVADTFGRAWRMGIANVALGVAGLPGLIDHRGRPDDFGHELQATVIAVADELAGAAELVMGKTERIPVAIVRGWRADAPENTGRDLIRPAELDLFR